MLDPDELLHDRLLTAGPLIQLSRSEEAGQPSEGLPTELSLSIAEVGFVLTSADPRIGFVLDEPTRRFLAPPSPDSFRFRVSLGRPPEGGTGQRVFDSGGSWTLSREGGDWIFEVFTPLNGKAPMRSARLDPDFSGGEIVLHESYYAGVTGVDPLSFPLAELLVIQRLARSGGVELHACGLIDEGGRGLLFAGRSGDGKTTTAKLWAGRQGVTILSDDRILLRRDGAGFSMHGTPWHGEGMFAANTSAPLSALFLLEHGAANEAVPLGEAEAVSGLLPRCFPPFYDRAGVESVLETLSEMARAVPCYRFPFVPDERAVALARRTAADLCP